MHGGKTFGSDITVTMFTLSRTSTLRKKWQTKKCNIFITELENNVCTQSLKYTYHSKCLRIRSQALLMKLCINLYTFTVNTIHCSYGLIQLNGGTPKNIVVDFVRKFKRDEFVFAKCRQRETSLDTERNLMEDRPHVRENRQKVW